MRKLCCREVTLLVCIYWVADSGFEVVDLTLTLYFTLPADLKTHFYGTSTEKKTDQCESRELCFVWAKMRSLAQESISDGSEELLQRGGGGQCYT